MRESVFVYNHMCEDGEGEPRGPRVRVLDD